MYCLSWIALPTPFNPCLPREEDGTVSQHLQRYHLPSLKPTDTWTQREACYDALPGIAYLPPGIWGAPAESMVMKLCSDLQANTERTLFNSIIIVLLSWSEVLVSSQSGIHEVVSSLEKLRIHVPGAILLMNGDWVQSLALSGTEEQNRQ